MSIFTKVITLALFTSALVACNKATDPKEVSVRFIEELNARNFDGAAALATADTKTAVVALKTEEQPAVAPAKQSTQDVFATDALQPYISGNSAIVKNNVIALNLQKVDGDWKVVASPDMVDDIVHRADRVARVKASWGTLKNEYLNRAVMLRDYINYVKSSGRNMPEVAALEQALKQLPTVSAEPTGEEIISFVKAQQVIDGLADKAMQPTMTASADLTMNYIINAQSQATRINEAKAAYNTAAAAAHSAVYKAVP